MNRRTWGIALIALALLMWKASKDRQAKPTGSGGPQTGLDYPYGYQPGSGLIITGISY
jgi:hypothetical protein